MNLAIVVGTRPQFVKLSALLPAVKRHGLKHFVITTGQHHHDRLSNSILKELGLPPIRNDLRIRDLRERAHFTNYGVSCDPRTLEIELGVRKLLPILREKRATHVLVIGDSNPAVVGAKAGRQLGLPVIHCEAGLRSGDPDCPEEDNRMLIDHYASMHFCSTERDRDRLQTEEPDSAPVFTGDLLVDVFERFRGASKKPPLWPTLGRRERVCLLTVHRTENARTPSRTLKILENIVRHWDGRIVWPVHPGMNRLASKLMHELPQALSRRVSLLEPATYLELNYMKQYAQLVVTDSVGLQVEAYLWRIASIILRNEVEHDQLERESVSFSLKPGDVLKQDIDTRLPKVMDRAASVDWSGASKTIFGKKGAADFMVKSATQPHAGSQKAARSRDSAAAANSSLSSMGRVANSLVTALTSLRGGLPHA